MGPDNMPGFKVRGASAKQWLRLLLNDYTEHAQWTSFLAVQVSVYACLLDS